MIFDKLGTTQQASEYYRLSLEKCEQDPGNKLVRSTTYKKAGTNYAVTLEKLG
jgi:hypothetical protein